MDLTSDFLSDWISSIVELLINTVLTPILNMFNLNELVPDIHSNNYTGVIDFFKILLGWCDTVCGPGIVENTIFQLFALTTFYLGVKLCMFMYDKITQIT